MNEYDVCVVGGGPSGTAAAIAAARMGARTVLCEATGILGGMGSAGMVSFFCVAHHDGHRMIIGGLFADIRERLVKRRAVYTAPGGNPKMLEPYDAAAYHLVLADYCEEVGVEFNLATKVDDVRVGHNAADLARVVLSDGETLEARTIVDATGNAVIARALGVPAVKGREGDGAVMPVNYCYRFGPIDLDEAATGLPECILVDPNSGERFFLLSGPNKEIDEAIARERAAGRLSIPRDHISAAISVPGQPTSISVNYGRVYCDDPTDPESLAKAQTEAQKQVEEGAAFLRRYVPGFSKGAIEKRAVSLGVRQSYQIEAIHMLTGLEAKACTQFDDVVAQCAYPFDIHEPGSDATTFVKFEYGTHFDIPWRSLVPRVGPPGLIVAGRAIGADAYAMSSFRVQSSVTAIGEAAGVTAAIAAADRVAIRDVTPSSVQAELRERGAVLT